MCVYEMGEGYYEECESHSKRREENGKVVQKAMRYYNSTT